MGRYTFHLPAFLYKTGQKTARVDKCWASPAVPLSPALQYGLSSFPASTGFALWIALGRIWHVYLVTFLSRTELSGALFFSGGSGQEGWMHSHTMGASFIFSVLMFQHWSQIFAFLTAETGGNLMLSFYQPLPVTSVIICGISLAKQQALGFLQPCWKGKYHTLLLHCHVGSAIIYWQSRCWKKEWCLFGS